MDREERGQQKLTINDNEGEMNYASVWLEDRRKLIWRGGDVRLIQAPFISAVTFSTSSTPPLKPTVWKRRQKLTAKKMSLWMEDSEEER